MIEGRIKRPGSDVEVACSYYPDVFIDSVVDLEYAKRLTVTKEGDLTSEVRWDVETRFTIDTLLSCVSLDENSLVLDYGCGVGRLAKALMERRNCSVVGADMSERMRSLAIDYVGSPRFTTCSSDELRLSGMKFDLAIASWVLQHCLYPAMDVELIAASLKPRSYFLLLNGFLRMIPINVPSDGTLCWMNDGLDVQKLVSRYFKQIKQGSFTVPELAALNGWTYWAIYQRNEHD